jgi:raffinose/stachyose/melibiose transport system permease protein
MVIQRFRGSFGHVDMGAMMASIMIDIIPIVIVYLVSQKYIIDGVVSGAVKG